MRAVYVLLCLALARDSACNIFRHQANPHMETLNMNSKEYLDQHQHEKDMKLPSGRHSSNSHESKEHYGSDDISDLSSAQSTNQHQRQHERDMKVPPGYHSYASHESKEHYGSDDISDLSSAQSTNQNQHQHERQMKIPQSYHSYSSHESKEHYGSDDISDLSTVHSKDWNAPVFSNAKTQDNKIPFADVIEWQGVQIAVGPSSPVSDRKELERIFRDAFNTVHRVSDEDKKKIHNIFEHPIENNKEEYNATQLLKKYKYSVEEHVVKTDDGYDLTLFRIKQKHDSLEVTQRPVVFLMHGVLGSADDWLLMGQERSLAYMLTDAGYDVWLGNTRGNKYSRHHASKSAYNPDFWQFSLDEIALHDLPVMIDFALNTSGQSKLFYIGHSQGSTIFFALVAARPEYREKITMMYALAPMVYMTNVRSPLLRMTAPHSPFFERLYSELGLGEFEPGKELIHAVGGSLCQLTIGCTHLCSNIHFVMTGINTESMDYNLLPLIEKHLPAGASKRQILHYAQSVSSDEFRKFDYGLNINKRIYGHDKPPKYNMTEVNVPVALYYSEEDWLAHPKDVDHLRSELPNVTEYYKVPEKHFGHMDFQFSTKAPELVYKRLIESLKNY